MARWTSRGPQFFYSFPQRTLLQVLLMDSADMKSGGCIICAKICRDHCESPCAWSSDRKRLSRLWFVSREFKASRCCFSALDLKHGFERKRVYVCVCLILSQREQVFAWGLLIQCPVSRAPVKPAKPIRPLSSHFRGTVQFTTVPLINNFLSQLK